MDRMDNNRPRNDFVRILMICAGATLMAFGIKTFVRPANLVPGGFTGIVVLAQEVFLKYFNIHLPFSVFYWLLNVVPAVLSFKYIGKKFALYSALMLLLSGFLTDLIPGFFVTDDELLSSIFGGIANGVAVTLCLLAGATSGGTDFIAIFVSEKTGKSVWNFIFIGNCVILAIAGILTTWEAALYSIIFQFTSTQILNLLYRRYSKTTLLIITDKTDEIYELIRTTTNHDATLFVGKGCYKGAERKMLYTVVSDDQAQHLAQKVRAEDPNAFINLLQTKNLLGKFYQRAKD